MGNQYEPTWQEKIDHCAFHVQANIDTLKQEDNKDEYIEKAKQKGENQDIALKRWVKYQGIKDGFMQFIISMQTHKLIKRAPLEAFDIENLPRFIRDIQLNVNMCDDCFYNQMETANITINQQESLDSIRIEGRKNGLEKALFWAEKYGLIDKD